MEPESKSSHGWGVGVLSLQGWLDDVVVKSK